MNEPTQQTVPESAEEEIEELFTKSQVSSIVQGRLAHQRRKFDTELEKMVTEAVHQTIAALTGKKKDS